MNSERVSPYRMESRRFKQLQHQEVLCYNEKVSRLWHNTILL